MKPEFYEPLSEQRPWGTEVVAALVPGVATMKLLYMKAGTKGRLQRHHFKDESGHVLKGRLLVRYTEGESIITVPLKRGQSVHFPPGCIHQEEAVTDCVILEVSTPHRNDREGMEEQFGVPVPPDALPSTGPEDVTMWEKWW
jgi:quercetin dioxygenase-like cupin family protein